MASKRQNISKETTENGSKCVGTLCISSSVDTAGGRTWNAVESEGFERASACFRNDPPTGDPDMVLVKFPIGLTTTNLCDDKLENTSDKHKYEDQGGPNGEWSKTYGPIMSQLKSQCSKSDLAYSHSGLSDQRIRLNVCYERDHVRVNKGDQRVALVLDFLPRGLESILTASLAMA
ncbi:hypothetical protein AAG570_013529 [Ranatra chinensis]|uniref:Uncharacterized protein n=1 Tax=Ranatra chinensis TaxID=642074 RepID=A0ABD0YP27_9HEMI